MKSITHKLNKTLLFYVFLFSTFVTMLATTSQLYFDYKKDIDYLDTLSTQIQKSHVKGLSTAAWNMDVLQIQVLLDGLVAITSDNKNYQPMTIPLEGLSKLKIIGRVVWSGHPMISTGVQGNDKENQKFYI